MIIKNNRNIPIRLATFLALILITLGPAQATSQVLYGVDSHCDCLYTIDPATGQATLIGPLDPARTGPDINNNFATPIAMAVRPTDSAIFVWNNSRSDPPPNGTTTGQLLTVDPYTGIATPVGPGTSMVFAALAFTPDGSTLFVLDTELWEVNQSSGGVTFRASLGERVLGADFSPMNAGGTLFAVTDEKNFYTISTAYGTKVKVSDYTALGIDPNEFPCSLVFDPSDSTGKTLILSTLANKLYWINTDSWTILRSIVLPSGVVPQGMGFVPAAHGLIDRTKWADLEFVREIVNEKLVSEVRAPNTNDSIGSTFRWANNSLNFPQPEEVTSIQAEVSVLRIIHTNPTGGTRAMLTGRWYSWYDADTQRGGDIWAAVLLGATPLGGLQARWEVFRFTNPEGTAWELIKDGNFGTPVTFGESHTLYISYDSDGPGKYQFTFKIGNGTSWNEIKTFGEVDGLPPRHGNANTPFKGLRTRVWLQGPTESGYISATFDNVYKNDEAEVYDNFNDLSGMINKDKWNPWELVRQSNEGLLESALTRYGSNGSNNMNFLNGRAVLGFEADVIVTDFENVGVFPTARLVGAFYNDGTPGDGMAGDIVSSMGIRHNGTEFVPYYAVVQCLSGNCNNPSGYGLPDEFNTLGYEELPPVSGGGTHRLSLSWNGSQFTFGFDGALYTPSIPLPPFQGLPKSSVKGIGTRIIGIEDNPSSDWGYIAARFDNVVITKTDNDLDGIDDAWEAQYCGGHCDPEELNANPDNDLLTNLQEYRYGTNPNIPDYKLTVTKSGTGDGTISRSPLGIDYAPSQYLYTTGTQVTLNATPAIGSYFVGWSGDCSGKETCIVTMDRARSVTAVFEYTFTISGTVKHKVEGLPVGLEGVTMDGFPVDYNPTPVVTNATGYYSGTVPYGWSGTVTPGKTGYTFIPDSTTYTNVTGNQTAQDYAALSAATTTKREEETGGLKICSEFTDSSGYPTGMYNCLDPSYSACNCPDEPSKRSVWDFKPFIEIQAGLDHITWVGPGPDPYSVDIITGSLTCVRRCYPSGYCYVGPKGCADSSGGSGLAVAVASAIVLPPPPPPPPPAITFRKEKIGDVEICSEPGVRNTSGCPTLVYSCSDLLKTPWPTKEFSQITADTGHITWVGIGSDPICPTVNIITASSTCVRRCYPSGYCYVGPPGCK